MPRVVEIVNWCIAPCRFPVQQGKLLAGRSFSEAWAAVWKECRGSPGSFEWRRMSGLRKECAFFRHSDRILKHLPKTHVLEVQPRHNGAHLYPDSYSLFFCWQHAGWQFCNNENQQNPPLVLPE
jgi:hypothetical protein